MAFCSGVKKDGTPCGRPASVGRDYCQAHDPDPEIRELVRERSRRGGQKYEDLTQEEKDALEPPRTIDELVEMVGQTMVDVRAGRCDHQRAKAIVELSKEQSRLLRLQKPDENAGNDKVSKMSDDELVLGIVRMIGSSSIGKAMEHLNLVKEAS